MVGKKWFKTRKRKKRKKTKVERWEGISHDKRKYHHSKMEFKTYGDYLKSNLWKSIRNRVAKRDGGHCKCCGSKAECVHHIKYTEGSLRGTSLRYLISLCNVCHGEVHGGCELPHGDTEKLFKMLGDAPESIKRIKYEDPVAREEYDRKTEAGENFVEELKKIQEVKVLNVVEVSDLSQFQ